MADSAGQSAIAEPASVVAEAIIAALQTDQFHVFPDSMAKQFEAAYQTFAKTVVEADLSGG